MGLFNILKKQPKFTDDLFGELAYTKFKDSNKNFYSYTVIFNEQQIGVNIDADENGPTQLQKEFYLKLRDSYQQIKRDIIVPFLNKELEDWLNEKPITNFESEFEMDGISLNRIFDKKIKWDIMFYCKKIDHYVTIEFIDFTPQDGVVVDG